MNTIKSSGDAMPANKEKKMTTENPPQPDQPVPADAPADAPAAAPVQAAPPVDETKGFLDKLVSLKEELTGYFESIGLGKDELLRVVNAIDIAHTVVSSHGGLLASHDLNDELAESVEDLPAAQGQVSTPIQTDDPASVPPEGSAAAAAAGTEAAPDQPAATDDREPTPPAGAAPVEERLGPPDEPHAPLPG